MKNVPVIDQPGWPAYQAAITPARISYRNIWKATDEKVDCHDADKEFRVIGYRASTRLEASVKESYYFRRARQ